MMVLSADVVAFLVFCFFFFNDTATTEIYTLSLHDALPIFSLRCFLRAKSPARPGFDHAWCASSSRRDRKSTRLNSSHSQISYAVFCLKKKKKENKKQAHADTFTNPTQHILTTTLYTFLLTT